MKASLPSILLLLALGSFSGAVGAVETLSHGRFAQISVYRPVGEVKQFVLFLAGEKGWTADLTQAAQKLSAAGAMVATIDTTALLANLDRDAASCTSPDGDLENLSRYIQAYYRLPTYMTPILVGYSSGAAFLYAMLAQAPADLFAGGISLEFCPDLPLHRPLCPGASLRFTQRANGSGIELAPASPLSAPWIALQTEEAQACHTSTAAFFAGDAQATRVKLPAAKGAYLSPDSGLPQLMAAYQSIAARTSEPLPPPASLADLPIVEVEAQVAGDFFAVFLSGDGGWAGIDKNVAAALAARGIPVAGLDSLRYFWSARTPGELAHDLDRMLRYYRAHWHRNRALAIGYSQGADVLPFAVNRLPAATRRKLILVAMLGLDDTADFEFHLSNWVSNGSTGLPVRPEIDKLLSPLALCVYGADDADTLCPRLSGTHVKLVPLVGGHHFNGAYDTLAEALLTAAHALH